ncbi:MAG: sulfatase-like hydrolase/transferase [Planctomycetota bacterium]
MSKSSTPTHSPACSHYHILAELLQQAGYRTAHFGKWHLGHNGPWDPASQGFELDFPHAPEAAGPGGGYFAPWSFIKSPPLDAPTGEHIDHRMAARAAEFIREHARESTPSSCSREDRHASLIFEKKTASRRTARCGIR